MDKVKFGLIGAGAIAQSHFNAFESVAEAELVAIADTRRNAAQSAAEQLSCAAYTDPMKMLSEGVCDAVIICTPPATHPDIANAYLAAGVHVLCEKPLAISSVQAEGMIKVARAHDAILTMGSKFRYVSDVIKAKAILDSGLLGEVILFENAFTGWVDMSNRWNAQPEISGGGVLIDNGTHSVDILRYFLGPIEDVHVVEGKRLQSDKVEDTVRLFAHAQDGTMCNVDLSWSLNKELESYVEIYGSQGTIKVGWQGSRYRQASSSEWVQFGTGYDKTQAFAAQLRNLVGAIHGSERLLITSEDALASVRVIEACYASMAKDTWVPVHGRTPSKRVA